MKIIKNQSIIIGSVVAVLLFSIGYVQESQAGIQVGITQGTLTINNQCTLTISAQDMNFGTADDGDFVHGFFDVRNVGNVAAAVPTVEGSGTQFGAWYIVTGLIDVIANTDTDVFTGTPTTPTPPAAFTNGVNLGDLATPRALPNIDPDFLSPTNNDERVDLETLVNLLIATSGAVVLDVLLTNTGCV